ncbi:MAG: hypothetical protein ACTSV7_11335 [Candidatus Baldrarchaeia archaeon]
MNIIPTNSIKEKLVNASIEYVAWVIIPVIDIKLSGIILNLLNFLNVLDVMLSNVKLDTNKINEIIRGITPRVERGGVEIKSIIESNVTLEFRESNKFLARR